MVVLVSSITDCHAGDRGSIPRQGGILQKNGLKARDLFYAYAIPYFYTIKPNFLQLRRLKI